MSQIKAFMSHFPKIQEKLGSIADNPERLENGQYKWHKKQVFDKEIITRGRVLIRVVGEEKKREIVVVTKPPFEKRTGSWWYEAVTLPSDMQFLRIEYSLADAGMFPFGNIWNMNCLLDTGIGLNDVCLKEAEEIADQAKALKKTAPKLSESSEEDNLFW